jgi:hypothetical protein
MDGTVRAALVALMLGACAPATPPPIELAALDAVLFGRDVQPYVAVACGTLDCHGAAGRPLRLYSELGLRLSADLRKMPLTDAEIAANVDSVEAVDPGAGPDDTLFVRKPLAIAAGGLYHKGGAIWSARTDAGYVCLHGWLTGADVSTACADAYAPIALPPP